MDTSFILNFLSEIAYFLIAFGVFFALAIFKGRQAVINLIVGLYLALLISIQFPYYDQLLSSFSSAQSMAAAKLVLFAVFTILLSLLAGRIMPDEFKENKFESVGKKFMLAIGATILVMIFSFQVLSITEFLTPGTPIQSLFAPDEYFFWWLLAPLLILFIV